MTQLARQAEAGDLVMRLIELLQRHRSTEPDAAAIEDALWRYVNGKVDLPNALGAVKPGFSWRAAQRLARRDELLRDLYRHHLSPISLRSAAMVIGQDWHIFGRRYWPRLSDIVPTRPPQSRIDYFHVLRAEGHQLPGLRRLIDILRPCAVVCAT